MQKNGEYTGTVSALGSEAEGIIYLDGCTVFVNGCLVGEVVKFKVLSVKGKIAYAKLLSVEKPSPDRVNPVCPVYGKCGGCRLQHMSYEAQLAFKRDAVKNCLKKLGGIEVGVAPTVADGRQFGYRNKLAVPVGVAQDGDCAVGFFAPRSHRIVPVDYCALQGDGANAAMAALKEFMKNATPYDEVNFTGDVRRLVVREIKGAYIITLVCAREIDLTPFAEILDKKFKNYTLLLNINPSRGNAVFGDKWHICRGEGSFSAQDMGVKYKAGAQTFLQVNDGVRTALYTAALKEAAGCGAAIDLYSGGGMLTAMLANACGRAYGIEIVRQAVDCADELMKLNGLDGKMFNICGAVEDKLHGVLAATEGADRVIICDPPRKGMERSVVKSIIESGAEKVILISCNPATLARDLGLLCGTLKERGKELIKSDGDGAYEIVSVTPYDMFPQTPDVETLVTLFHKKPDSHIKVTVDLENGKIKK